MVPQFLCDRCERIWTDEWSCTCDDECPHCGQPDMSPFDSEDLTEFVVEERGQFVVLRSPDTAEHDPDYEELARFPTRAKAEEFLAELE
jgi:hypothetical protein